MFFEGLQKISKFQILDLVGRDVSTPSLNQASCKILFELLETHDLLFNGILQDKSVDIDSACLTDSMGSVHCLEVFHWVPVMLSKDHDICSSQRQAKTSHRRRQNHDPVCRIRVESVHDLDTVLA
jgi:hypothetical protein